MDVVPIQNGVFFSPRERLPRGRNALGRDEVREIQSERLLAAYTELIAAHGLTAVSVTDVVGHTSVSRTAFYDCFEDIAACADAAYQRFITVVVQRVSSGLDHTSDWRALIESAVRGYLGVLQEDLVVARALQIEMDAAGRAARDRRRNALRAIAQLLHTRHAEMATQDPTMGLLPLDAFVGFVYAIRQLACDALEAEEHPDLLRLVDPIMTWAEASVVGMRMVSAPMAAERAPEPFSARRR